jgi:hypothetical protein
MKEASKELIAKARELYAKGSDDNIEIDENAKVSEMDNGTWVQAWVWIPSTEKLH